MCRLYMPVPGPAEDDTEAEDIHHGQGGPSFPRATGLPHGMQHEPR
jgi:hypothetical protein